LWQQKEKGQQVCLTTSHFSFCFNKMKFWVGCQIFRSKFPFSSAGNIIKLFSLSLTVEQNKLQRFPSKFFQTILKFGIIKLYGATHEQAT
jgi:hypothetical protein